MKRSTKLRSLLAMLAVAVFALALGACGDDSDDGGSDDGGEATSDTAIVENPENNGIELTIGSKNFTEQFILGEIYAQALEAAGYDISTDLNLGSEQIALKSLENGVGGYATRPLDSKSPCVCSNAS